LSENSSFARSLKMFGENLERLQLPGLPSVGEIKKGVEQTRSQSTSLK
jgi:hypothetical protein